MIYLAAAFGLAICIALAGLVLRALERRRARKTAEAWGKDEKETSHDPQYITRIYDGEKPEFSIGDQS